MQLTLDHNVPTNVSKGLMLRAGTVAGATLVAPPTSTKNAEGERDTAVNRCKNGEQWNFGAHIGVDADSSLLHAVRGTTGGVNDVAEANALRQGEQTEALGDAGFQGADKWADAKPEVRWNIAMRPSKRRALDKSR